MLMSMAGDVRRVGDLILADMPFTLAADGGSRYTMGYLCSYIRGVYGAYMGHVTINTFVGLPFNQ